MNQVKNDEHRINEQKRNKAKYISKNHSKHGHGRFLQENNTTDMELKHSLKKKTHKYCAKKGNG